MKNFLTNRIFMLVAIFVCIFTLCFGIYEYKREHTFRCDILHAQLQLNNYTMKDNSVRITIVDTIGNVLYDNKEKDVSRLSNHIKRKEIRDALLHGSGYDIKRESATDGETYFYSATYFPDRGVIIRSAVPYSAPLTHSLERNYTFFYYTIGIFLLIAFVLYLKYRLSKSEQEKQRIKRQVTENAAHELKTPAATIEGYLETLVNNPDLPKEQRETFISNCFSQSQRMCNLLRDMSTLTRLDEANLPRPNTKVNCYDIINNIIQETSDSFNQKNISVEFNSNTNLFIDGDDSLLYSLFRNIFDNTLAYATNASYFRIDVKDSKDYISFNFIDNGIGVPNEELSHIFERFYRIDKSRSRRLGGTGLGLAIVKNIAIQYGGSVNASTTNSRGLTISVTLRR